MESWIELLENDGDESSTSPPCYTPNDPLALAGSPLDNDATDEANCVNNAPSIPPPPYTSNDQLCSSDNEMNLINNPNTPPPLYSFDDQTVSSEFTDDLPPAYQDI